MQAALQILGYDPTFHGFSIFYNVRDVEMWREGIEAKFFPNQTKINPFGRTEFDQLLGGYRALCDMPAVIFASELIAAYPEAKIVLVERDIETWYGSFDAAVIQPMFNPVANFISKLDRKYLNRLNLMTTAVIRGFFRSNTKQELIDNARPVYREHYDTVRRLAEKERLLEFQLKDGWEPLCKFLGKPVPECPFPRINDAAAIEEKIAIVLKMASIRFLKFVGVISSGVGAAMLAIYWYNRQ
jgi:hypothetical protein